MAVRCRWTGVSAPVDAMRAAEHVDTAIHAMRAREEPLGVLVGVHGAMSLDQLFSLRPALGYADYRSPVAGLYHCGSGAHPGG